MNWACQWVWLHSIMIKFVLLVNKQGQTRLSQYYEYISVEERVTSEADIVRKCLARNEDQVITIMCVCVAVIDTDDYNR